MDKKDFTLMDDLMWAITTSEEWNTTLIKDPVAAKRNAHLNSVMEKVKSYLPNDLYVELADAQTSASTAYIEPAILYGIRVAGVIRDAATHPMGFSQHIVERANGD